MLAILSNALSHRNIGSLDGIDHLATAAKVAHVRLEGIGGLDAALEQLAAEGTSVLIVNGGDGTVQAVVTELLRRRPFAVLPSLVVLRGGHTNMTAADVGPAGGNRRALQRFLNMWQQRRERLRALERAVLRVRDAANGIDAHGFFFGDAAIVETIALCKRQAYPLGLAADAASAFTLISVVVQRLFGGDAHPLFRGHAAEVSLDGVPLPPRRWTVQLATTLDRLVLRCRPYWQSGGRPLRWTGIRHPAPALLRHAPRILYGGEQRPLPADTYFSSGAERVVIRSAEPFTIDGEIFATAVDRTIEITAEDRLQFLTF